MPQPEHTTHQPGVFQQLDTVNPFPYSKQEYIRRALWELIGVPMIRFSFRRAARWRRFWLRLFGGRIDDTSHFKSTTRIRHPWLLTIGQHSAIAEHVEVYNLGPIEIGDHSVVSQFVHLCAGTHDYTKPSLPLQRPSIRIGSGVWVCANAFIGPGVTIGNNSLVGAAAVVTKDVPEGVIVAGNPAKVIKPRPMPGLGTTTTAPSST